VALKPDVEKALEEIRANFPEATLTCREDPEGGAFVTIDPLDLGAAFNQRVSWVGFHITFQYPNSDVYPHFVRGDLARVNGAALGAGLTAGTFENRPAIQVSRRSNHLNPELDTAAIKLLKVLSWLRDQ